VSISTQFRYFSIRTQRKAHLCTLLAPLPGLPMVGLVERMFSLREQLTEAKFERARTIIQHQLDVIDRLVYELYGFTDEKIEIAEQTAAS
jgi:hypothetical protein